MTLLDLVKLCDQAYQQEFPESSLLIYVNPMTGIPLNFSAESVPPIGDTLALFIVRELDETFDDEASDKEQRETAARVLTHAKRNLDAVINILEETI